MIPGPITFEIIGHGLFHFVLGAYLLRRAWLEKPRILGVAAALGGLAMLVLTLHDYGEVYYL